eukprot:1744716-Amphidinium_carterae.1
MMLSVFSVLVLTCCWFGPNGTARWLRRLSDDDDEDEDYDDDDDDDYDYDYDYMIGEISKHLL